VPLAATALLQFGEFMRLCDSGLFVCSALLVATAQSTSGIDQSVLNGDIDHDYGEQQKFIHGGTLL